MDFDKDILLEAFSEDWEEVKSAALVTIHKRSLGNAILSDWKDAMTLSRHSPIREFRIKVTINNIPRWVADQLVRHNVGINNYMGTGRPDRGHKSRKEQTMEDLTVFKQSYNIDSFLNFCNTRLCIGSVSKLTRELVEAIVDKLFKLEPEIAKYCVPPCIKTLNCKEEKLMELAGLKKCAFLKAYIAHVVANDIDFTNSDKRYNSYHNFRKER